MKHLLALMALCVAFVAGAQTGLVEFPYNPDADNDDVIGTADLLALLSLYGSEFSEEGTYLSADSTTALYYAGSFDYAMCLHQCSNLSGNWHIPSREQFCQVIHPSESTVTGQAWLSQSPFGRQTMAYNRDVVIEVGYPNDSDMYETNSEGQNKCFCFTQERPKVEYTYVQGSINGGDPTYFQTLATAKIEDGWYPLGGIQFYGQEDQCAQAFWRWAE